MMDRFTRKGCLGCVLNVSVYLSFYGRLYIHGVAVGSNRTSGVGLSYLCGCERVGLEKEMERALAL